MRLGGFKYEVQLSANLKQIRELATSRWIGNGNGVMILGPPGVGEKHLAAALRREAIVRGYSTLFVPATGLLTQLARGHAEGMLEEGALHQKPAAGRRRAGLLAVRGERRAPVSRW